MKVLLENDSPYKKGCIYTVLSEVEKQLNQEGIETKMYWLGNAPLAGCIDCGKCKDLHKCVFDDGVNEFREVAKEYDGSVFGTPVYCVAMNGRRKSFLDRLFFSDLWGQNYTFTHKPVACAVSARHAGATNAYDKINSILTIIKCQL